jgi:nicotinate-nucleotide adenylyltransferase
MTVGLFGGSFDPPHAGHVHVSREALKRLGLDRVWWLVSPGNPLKERGPAPLDRRMAAARNAVTHPRIVVTDIEKRLGTRYTGETIEALIHRYPGCALRLAHGGGQPGAIPPLAALGLDHAHGADLRSGPSGAQGLGAHGEGRAGFSRGRDSRRANSARCYCLIAEAPAWVFLNVPMVDVSSTEIRARGDW